MSIPAPPPQQKKSTIISSFSWLKPRPYWVLKLKGGPVCGHSESSPVELGFGIISGVKLSGACFEKGLVGLVVVRVVVFSRCDVGQY